jgi:hypothetical protein
MSIAQRCVTAIELGARPAQSSSRNRSASAGERRGSSRGRSRSCESSAIRTWMRAAVKSLCERLEARTCALLYRERALGMRALARLSGEHRMRSPRPVSRRGAGQTGAPGGINNNANRSYINKTTRHHRIVGKRRYIDFRQARIDVLLVRWGPAVARLRSVEILRGEDRRSDGPARCPLQASSSDLELWRYPTLPIGLWRYPTGPSLIVCLVLPPTTAPLPHPASSSKGSASPRRAQRPGDASDTTGARSMARDVARGAASPAPSRRQLEPPAACAENDEGSFARSCLRSAELTREVCSTRICAPQAARRDH